MGYAQPKKSCCHCVLHSQSWLCVSIEDGGAGSIVGLARSVNGEGGEGVRDWRRAFCEPGMMDALSYMRCLKEIGWCFLRLRKGKRTELGWVKWEGAR